MLRFSIRSLLAMVALVGVTLAALRSGSFVAASLFFSATVGLLGAALIVAVVGQGRRRAFAVGFAGAVGLYLLMAFAVSHSPQWDDAWAPRRLALWFIVQSQRMLETEFHGVANAIDSAFAIAAGLLGGTLALIAVGRRRDDAAQCT